MLTLKNTRKHVQSVRKISDHNHRPTCDNCNSWARCKLKFNPKTGGIVVLDLYWRQDMLSIIKCMKAWQKYKYKLQKKLCKYLDVHKPTSLAGKPVGVQSLLPLKIWRGSLMQVFGSRLNGRIRFQPTFCHFSKHVAYICIYFVQLPPFPSKFAKLWCLSPYQNPTPKPQSSRKKCSWGTHLARKGPGRQATARGVFAGSYSPRGRDFPSNEKWTTVNRTSW